MTTHLQPGQHPDVDQLNAFAEHALPPHQQQATLAHLAACPDCRGIVFLAQSALPEAVLQSQPAPARRPWFAGWMLAFPAAAALAGLVLITLHLYNPAAANQPAAAVTTAHLQQTPPPPAPAQPATPPSPAPAPRQMAATVSPPAPLGAAKMAGVPETNDEALRQQTLNGLLRGRSAPELPRPEAPVPSDSFADKKSIHGNIFGTSYAAASPASPPPVAGVSQPGLSGAGTLLHSSSNQYDSARVQTQPAAASAVSGQGVYGGTGATDLNQAYVAGVPAAPAPPQAATDETVTVTMGAAPVDAAAPAPLRSRILPVLPSKLPVLSIITDRRQQLALDTAGALFRSADAGVTWQPIPAQWTGRAIKVALIAPANLHLLQSAGALDANISATPHPLFELTTESGSLWTSSDGQVWTLKH